MVQKFKLLGGQHIADDKMAKPTKVVSGVDVETGKPLIKEKHPERTWVAGDIIEVPDDHEDLCDKHGYNKFERLTEKRDTPAKPLKGAKQTGDAADDDVGTENKPTIKAPGGQVLQGVQTANLPKPEDGGEHSELPKATASAPQPLRSNKPLPNNLAVMSIKDLQTYAEDEEIDLKGASKRDDIIRVIREQHGSK